MSFDISSAVIGWAVFDINEKKDISLIESGYIKPAKIGDIFENLSDLKSKIIDMLELHKPQEVAIEDIVQFMPNISSARTIIKLSLYNRIVGLTVFEYLGISPILYSVMTIRHGIKQTKQLPKKEEIPALVEKILGITLNVQHKKSGKIRPELYDEADAISCGLYHCFKKTNQLDKIKQGRKNNGDKTSLSGT